MMLRHYLMLLDARYVDAMPLSPLDAYVIALLKTGVITIDVFAILLIRRFAARYAAIQARATTRLRALVTLLMLLTTYHTLATVLTRVLL